MSKMDLFRKDWLDVVFEHRNKRYGAYKLRMESPRTTTFAFFGGIALFGVLFLAPSVLSSYFEDEIAMNTGTIEYLPEIIDKEVELKDLVLPEEEPKAAAEIPVAIKEEAPPAAPASIVDQIKFLTPDIANSSEVKEELPPQSVFANANVGAENIKGNVEGQIVINGNAGTNVLGEDGAENTEDSGNAIIHAVQIKAEPIGGMTKFSRSFVSRFKNLDLGMNVEKIQVILSFVVEKDGSLTDIRILRDPGYGAGAEAIRVLKTMPNWKAAMQNGKNVRSQFTLPITIQVNH
ncbi:energy transducer TonB [Myroides indicus]|uniref:Outer membrane transport energization protein TonB n=1 Tax=Myroides indicus TaxID=1323422 RepID=A0A4R7F216_9FLAO|nr:energy transducer TonB [Myroides indicus]TDS64349.1 outer membrane transport energization protein TonB [Myroides indicus]